jgi:predicted metal-binding protein
MPTPTPLTAQISGEVTALIVERGIGDAPLHLVEIIACGECPPRAGQQHDRHLRIGCRITQRGGGRVI